MDETTEAAAPAPEVPAAETKPEVVAPEGTAPNAEEVGKAAVAEVEAAREPAAPVADIPADVPAVPEVMAQAEPDHQGEPHAPPTPNDPAKEVTPTPETTVAELHASPEAVKEIVAMIDDPRIAELAKALEDGNFSAAPEPLRQGSVFEVGDERQVDVPGSDPRCTP